MAEKKNDVPFDDGECFRICSDCKLVFTNIREYVEHLESRAHVERVMRRKYRTELQSKGKISTPTAEYQPNEVFTCELCNEVITGYLNQELHTSSEIHQRNLMTARNRLEEKVLQDAHEPEEEDHNFDDVDFRNLDSFSYEPSRDKRSDPELSRQITAPEDHNKREGIRRFSTGILPIAVAGSSRSHESGSFDIQQKKFSGPSSCPKPAGGARGLKCLNITREIILHSKREERRLKKESLKKFQEKYPHSIVIDGKEGECTIFCTECSDTFDNPESAQQHFEEKKHGNTTPNKPKFE